MKKWLKRILIKLLSNDKIGAFVKKLSLFFWKIKYQRDIIERKRKEVSVNNLTSTIFKDKIVLNGPLKGLKYPGFNSRNSSLYSKLIGSYEKELHPVFETIIKTDYKQLLDIGCAEGYYAVGLALKMPQLTVHAYDIEKESRELTRDMSQVNGVQDRVKIYDSCTAKTLAEFNFAPKTLIISDCEGYERYLFDKSTIENLKTVDLLIETHDFMDVNISTNLEKLFEHTHHIQIIQSVGDVFKAKYYKYEEVKNESLETRYRIFEEGRNFTDEWLFMTPKNL